MRGALSSLINGRSNIVGGDCTGAAAATAASEKVLVANSVGGNANGGGGGGANGWLAGALGVVGVGLIATRALRLKRAEDAAAEKASRENGQRQQEERNVDDNDDDDTRSPSAASTSRGKKNRKQQQHDELLDRVLIPKAPLSASECEATMTLNNRNAETPAQRLLRRHHHILRVLPSVDDSDFLKLDAINSCTWKGMHKVSGKMVSIKELVHGNQSDLLNPAGPSPDLKRFLREVDALSKINQRHVLSVRCIEVIAVKPPAAEHRQKQLENGSDSDEGDAAIPHQTLRIIFDHVSQSTLADLLEMTGAVNSESRLRNYATQLLLALQALHGSSNRPIVGAAINPNSILVDEEGCLRVSLDSVAIAAKCNSNTMRSVLAASLPFLAPEVIQEGRIEPSSDIWAVGATLLWACGVAPQGGSQIPPNLSRPATDFFSTILNRDPKLRGGSASALLKHSWLAAAETARS